MADYPVTGRGRRAEPVVASEAWRSFKFAAWLGWQITSNWTDPLLFAIYSIVRPVARAAILVIMYGVITGNNFTDPLFPYIFLGNAFYTYVFSIMNGVSWAVIDDREHYRTLKYMYIAPIRIPAYLLGRGVAGFLTASLSVLITILAGVLFLHVTFDPLQADWLLFVVTMVIGVVMLALMGLVLGAISLLIVRHSGFIAESVSGVLFLFSGAIYPLDVLPKWLQPIGFAMPITYWLELVRRSLIGDVAQVFPTLASVSNLELLGILVGLSVLFGMVSIYIFRLCDRRARERGLIDRTTNY
jgi:ABC-2 type transport system permease protein